MTGPQLILNFLTAASMLLIVVGSWRANPRLDWIAAGMFFFVLFAFGPWRRERPLPR